MRWAVIVGAVIVGIVSWAAMAGAQGAQGSPTAGPWDPPSSMLTRALRLYEQGGYDAASIELHRVMSGVSSDTPGNVKRAQLVLGAALHRMGYPAAALAMFDRIVQEGSTHPRHLEVVWWLLAVGEVPGVTVGPHLKLYREELDAVVATLDEARRAALFYQLGAELAAAGEVDEARALLERVPAGSSHAGRARLQRARLQLRSGELAAGTAAAIAKAGDAAVVATDAARAIAESRYVARDRAGARAALQELAAVTPAAAFARSRIELEDARALPGLAEAPVAAFEAVAVATACAQGWTDQLLPRAAVTIRNAREAIDELLGESDDNAETYEAVARYLEESARGGGTPKASAIVVRMALARIGAPMAWVAELRDELDQLQRADRAWQTTEVAAEVLQELTVQHSVAAADLGKLFRERLASVRRDLDGVARAVGAGGGAAIAAGPDAARGRGLVVTAAMCAAALGRAPEGAQVAAGSAAAAPAVRGHGCAGCAGGGEPSLVLGLAWLAGTAARRAGARRRARRSGRPA